jgi:hypothetical protein
MPVCIVIIVASVSMVLVYLAVRKQGAAGDRWRFPHPTGNSVTLAAESSNGLTEVATGESRPPRRQSSSRGTRNRMEQTVFWQCVFYLGAFYLTWPIQIIGSFYAGKDIMPYWFWCLVFGLSPMQGFWNFVVYTRPRLLTYLRERKQKSILARERAQGSCPS